MSAPEPNCAKAPFPELFFDTAPSSVRQAKEWCKHCPLKTPCLTLALEEGHHFGVWGGMSEHERRALNRKRRRAA